MLQIHDPVAAFCFDDAVSIFGNWVENKLNETDKSGRPKFRLKDLLRSTDLTAPPVPVEQAYNTLKKQGVGLITVKEIKAHGT